jgi:hypothetical protein
MGRELASSWLEKIPGEFGMGLHARVLMVVPENYIRGQVTMSGPPIYLDEMQIRSTELCFDNLVAAAAFTTTATVDDSNAVAYS